MMAPLPSAHSHAACCLSCPLPSWSRTCALALWSLMPWSGPWRGPIPTSPTVPISLCWANRNKEETETLLVRSFRSQSGGKHPPEAQTYLVLNFDASRMGGWESSQLQRKECRGLS